MIDAPMLNTVLVLVVGTSVLGPVLTGLCARHAGGKLSQPRPVQSVLGRGGQRTA
ncbi:MAG: hypothetical protein OJF58_001469 [Enhydrobacter sp.]|nr:MAG: hypothetical protein OJF58_001469 [Enhydrobacter sp.]